MAKIKETQIIKALESVEDPELHRSIVALDMVRDVRVNQKTKEVGITIALTTSGCPLKAEIETRISDALGKLGIEKTSVDFTVMSAEELQILKQKLQGGGAQNGNGHDHGHDHSHGESEKPETRPIPFSDLDSRTRCLLISSGKGGVGKSSVSVNLAVALAARGKSVAIMDADVWGFSIPRMLGITQKPVVLDNMLLPPEAHGVRCISTGFFAEEGQPVIWRGPMLHKALRQFLADVFWDDPDYLIVDLPPGTGDISISLSQYLPRAEVYVVTTPQVVAQKVAQRAGIMAEKVNLEVRGVIENMSWFIGDGGKRYELFGAGGGQELAELLGVPLLAQIPFVEQLREGGDTGSPITATNPESEVSQKFASLAERVDTELAPTRIYSSKLKVN